MVDCLSANTPYGLIHAYDPDWQIVADINGSM